MKSIYLKEQNFILSKNNYSNPNTYNALDAGIAFLLFNILMIAVQYPAQKIISAIYLQTGDYALCMIVSALMAQFIIVGISFVFSLVRKVGFLSGGGFVCRFNAADALMGAVFCYGVYFLLSSTHYEFVDDWTYIIHLTNYDTYTLINSASTEYINPVTTLFYTFVIVPVLPAICEESLFRGVIMRGLRQFGDVFAVICSALIFAIMHGNYTQFVLQFAVGIAIGSAVMITDNIFVGMAMHFMYNLGTVIISVVPAIFESFVPMYSYLYGAIGIITGFVLLIVAVLYFGRIFMEKYRRKVKGLPELVRYENYYALDDSVTPFEEPHAYFYASVLPFYYTKTNTLRFYYRKGFAKFNKASNKILSLSVLAVGIIVAVVKIVVSALS